jgi:WD40 repeat protein
MTYNHASKRAHATLQPNAEISTNAAANPAADDDGEEGEAVNGVECVAFAPEVFKFVSTGGLDHQVHIWEMSTGHLRVSLAHDGGVVSMSWHPSMPFLVTGCLDGAVRLWDGRNGECLQMFTGHAEMVTNVALHIMPFPLLIPAPPTETQSTEGANTAIQPPAPPATTPALSQNTLTIVSTSDDSTARVFVLDLNALQE